MRYKAFAAVVMAGLISACGAPTQNETAIAPVANNAASLDSAAPSPLLENARAQAGSALTAEPISPAPLVITEPTLAEQIAIFTDVSGSERLEQNWLSRLDPTIPDAEPPQGSDVLSIWAWRASNGRSLSRAKRLLTETRAAQRQKARQMIVTINTELGLGSDSGFYNKEDEEIELRLIRLGADLNILDARNNPLTFSWDNGAAHAYIPIAQQELEGFVQLASPDEGGAYRTVMTLRLALDILSAVELSADKGRFRAHLNHVDVLGANGAVLWSSKELD